MTQIKGTMQNYRFFLTFLHFIKSANQKCIGIHQIPPFKEFLKASVMQMRAKKLIYLVM